MGKQTEVSSEKNLHTSALFQGVIGADFSKKDEKIDMENFENFFGSSGGFEKIPNHTSIFMVLYNKC